MNTTNINAKPPPTLAAGSVPPPPRVWLTARYGGIAHTLREFQPGLVAVMRCGVVLPQWRDAERERKCKRCSPNERAHLKSRGTRPACARSLPLSQRTACGKAAT